MFELMLMRHAKSDWSAYTADIDRPLNSRGRRDADLMGAHLSSHKLIPDRLVVSAAQRTRETASLILQHLPVLKDNVIIDKELYLADRGTICELIELYARASSRSGQRLMLLAHNPGMDDVVRYLSSRMPPLSDNGKLMTTCAVARFRLDAPESVNKPGQGELIDLLRPKEIAEQVEAGI